LTSGSYCRPVPHGDILIRDRKMYVVPTPFRLVEGVAHQQTMIVPADTTLDGEFIEVGELRRCEADELILGYSFDLQTNEIMPKKVPNPGAGREHVFRAWRLKGSVADLVSMRNLRVDAEIPEADEETVEE